MYFSGFIKIKNVAFQTFASLIVLTTDIFTHYIFGSELLDCLYCSLEVYP